MSRKETLLKGTFILTITGLITRVIGFFYRIFMSHLFGESGVGLYQLIFPVYALIFSFSSAGIEIALSRCVSKYLALNNKKKASEMLYTSITLSLTLSILSTLLLQKYAYFISNNYLQNADTYELLIILSYIFPFASLHSCIVGYYMGIKQTKIISISQLIEQGVRVLSVLLIYKLCIPLHFHFSISAAVTGLIFGEISSAAFCIHSIRKKVLSSHIKHLTFTNFLSCSAELLHLSFPLTGSRVLLNILQSIEAVSIPISLELYGLTSKESLTIYGVLTGMALPCILFPSAITNAVSTMLLPTVSEIQALDDINTLKILVKKTIVSCTLLGISCCIGFLFSGNFIGKILFNSSLAGKFILTLAWICPFLYTNNTLISIINGIGKTMVSFVINAFTLSLRILSVLKLIPIYGIYGYLIGLLLSQILSFIFSLLFLYKKLKAKVL